MAAKRNQPSRMRPELELALMFGLGAMLLLMGAVVLLTSTGIVANDDYAGPFARLIAFLFSLVILVTGLGLFAGPLLVIAGHLGARDPFSATALGVRRLVRRVDPRSAAAAALLAPLALGYWRALRGEPLWLWSGEGLIGVVMIEFLLIHGFPFLVFAGMFATVPDRWPSRAGITGVALLSLLYAAFAWSVAALWGVVELAYLSAPNVLAVVRGKTGAGPAITVGARWVLKLVLFFGVAVLVDERSLRGEGNLEIGAIYFTLQVLVELFRVAEIPVDLAATWARVPAYDRRAVVPQWTEGS